MSRVFRRGELELAVLHVVADSGPASGYAIMQALAERVGGSWRPSPGSVYPALLALEDRGLVAADGDDGTREYVATPHGVAERATTPDLFEAVAARAADADPVVTAGRLLDDFAAAHPARANRLDENTRARVAAILADATRRITQTLEHRRN